MLTAINSDARKNLLDIKKCMSFEVCIATEVPEELLIKIVALQETDDALFATQLVCKLWLAFMDNEFVRRSGFPTFRRFGKTFMFDIYGPCILPTFYSKKTLNSLF